MYSGSQKFNRNATSRGGATAGSGGASKRKSFPPPQHHHRHSTPNNRLSFSGSGSNSRHRTPPSSAPPPPQHTADESFRLVGGEPLSLAAIVRLVPELVDDIKRLEAQGGAARFKFDHKHNTDANVIDVGGKEYRFIWANEKNCDIYEERQGGEDGNGLLVETGYAWRSLTVQRKLDNSAMDRVRRNSIECQQTLKARKAIVLDADNPSMKSQMKAHASAKASTSKYKQNKDFQAKKRNNEPTKAVGIAKPVHRPGLSSTTYAKGRHSTSPLPSPQNQYISFASPSAKGSAADIQTIYDPTSTEARTLNIGSPDKILSPREGVPYRDNQGAGVLDLQHLIITLLKDNSKGMSLKALEKAIGDANASQPTRRIESVLKKIATFEPPGRYMLKPGVEAGNVNSSPEDNHQRQSASSHVFSGVPAPVSSFAEKAYADNVNDKLEGESTVVENFDPSQHLTDLFGDDEAPDHNEVQAANTSNSDSDSGAASSDSGANSASQSRSKSPAGSASASSSDSEADSSSNSKETSDVEIDIMSDDDKEPKKLLDKGHGLSENNGVQDGYASEEVDIENDFLGDNEADLATISHGFGTPTGNLGIVSHDHEQQQTFGLTDVGEEQEYGEDKFKHERPGNILNSKSKSKRGSNVLQMERDTDNVKRVKARNLAPSSASDYKGSHALQSPSQILPDMRNVDHHDNHRLQMSNRLNRHDYGNEYTGDERGYNNHVPEKSNVESQPSSRRPPIRSHITNNADKPAKNPFTYGLDAKDQDNILKQGGKDVVEAQEEDGSSNEKGNGKYKESPLGQTSSMRPDLLYKHDSARSKKSSDMSTRKRIGLSSEDTSKGNNVDKFPKGRMLQRELSDLEVGEFREPLVEQSDKGKKLEKVSSFKHSEAMLGTDSRNAAFKANLSCQPTLDPENALSPNLRNSRKSDSLPKRKSPEPYCEDAVRRQKGTQAQQQQSRSVHAEVESLSKKAVDLNRLEYGEGFANQGTDIEGYGETQRKSYDNAPREDSRQELESHKSKGNKSRKTKAIRDGEDKSRDVSVGRVGKRKRNDSSSDENASYTKYEKDEPELKGPIKSFSQYKEYVQEFCDKYDSYCSLNKILENYRNEFQKLGLDLESAKGRDTERYYGILAQLRESYRQCGTRHKRLKKIFIVLHEELEDLKQRIKDFAVDYMKD